jgi:hypothetical protein
MIVRDWMKDLDRFRLARAWTTRTRLVGARRGESDNDDVTWLPQLLHKRKGLPLQLRSSGTWEPHLGKKSLCSVIKPARKAELIKDLFKLPKELNRHCQAWFSGFNCPKRPKCGKQRRAVQISSAR